MVWVQAIRSAAVNATCSHAWLMPNSRDGKRPMPVCLIALTRSSTWAWARCRASRNGSWPWLVPVAMHRYGDELVAAPGVSPGVFVDPDRADTVEPVRIVDQEALTLGQ